MENVVSIYSPGASFTKQLIKNLGLSSFLSEQFYSEQNLKLKSKIFHETGSW